MRNETSNSFLLDLTHDLFIQIDLKGVVSFANQKFYNVIGHTKEEVLGKNIFSFIKKNTVFENEEMICPENIENFATGDIYQKHILLKIQKKETHPFSVNLQFDKSTQNFSCMFMNTSTAENLFDKVCQQVEGVKAVNSKLKSMQGRLIQNEKMAALGALSAGVAHEINNPLSYVLSNIHALKEYVGVCVEVNQRLLPLLETDEGCLSNEKWEEGMNFVRAIHLEEDLKYVTSDMSNILLEIEEGANRVKTIVKDLRCFTHNEEKEWGFVDINVGLQNSVKMVKTDLRFKCDFELKLDDVPLIWGHAGQLNQVFMNLLLNAGQALSKGDGYIKVSTFSEIDQVVIKIEDNGSGMQPEILNRIFDPFYTTKEVGEGTGLGLSIAYGIVKEHKGYIDLASTPDIGTEFQIYLPIKKKDDT